MYLVFVTKYRRDVLSKPAIRDLTGIFADVCEDFGTSPRRMQQSGRSRPPARQYPPQVPISKLVNSLKGVSSRLLRSTRPVSGRYFGGVLWSPSYFAASCGGVPITIVRQYVEQQREAAPPPRPERRGIRRRTRG